MSTLVVATQDEPEFPEMPATQLAVNFPLVDVLPPADNMPTNGPTEIIPGTHRLSVAEGQVQHPLVAAVHKRRVVVELSVRY